MTPAEFHIFAIVEGYSEIDAVPKLLHRIWTGDNYPVLRTDEEPYRVPKGSFIDNAEKRRRALAWGGKQARKNGGGVVILMDADSACCKDFLQSEKAAKIHADISEILESVPHFFALAEIEYESWLVAGLDGDNAGRPKKWLSRNPEKTGLHGEYKNMFHQAELTAKFDIDLACQINVSFRRFREKVLKMTAA